MRYNALQSIGIFKLFRQSDPEPETKFKRVLLPSQYPDSNACLPTPLPIPEGSNVYFGWGALLDRLNDSGEGPALLPDHLAMIEAVRGIGGVIDFGLEPTSTSNAAACHQAVIDNPVKLRAVFAALQEQISLSAGNGFKIVVRYASEMNQPGDKNPYAGDPTAYKAGFAEVVRAREEVAPDVLLAFSPAINAAVGRMGPSPAGTSPVTTIRDYWPTGGAGVNVLSCTLYCRPQKGVYTDNATKIATFRDEALTEVMKRANTYFKSSLGTGMRLMIDEFGGSMRPASQTDPTGGQAPMPPDNDGMMQRMLNRLLQSEGDPKIEYCTLFLVVVWGRDAGLSFIP